MNMLHARSLPSSLRGKTTTLRRVVKQKEREKGNMEKMKNTENRTHQENMYNVYK